VAGNLPFEIACKSQRLIGSLELSDCRKSFEYLALK
jgi:hypothetical protein